MSEENKVDANVENAETVPNWKKTYETVEFKIPTVPENGDLGSAVIAETGYEYNFTYVEFLQILESNEKIEKECRAQLELDKAQIANLVMNHPFVAELTPVQRVAAKMYSDIMPDIERGEEKLKSILDAKEKNEYRKEQILKALPQLAEIKLGGEEKKVEEVKPVETTGTDSNGGETDKATA